MSDLFTAVSFTLHLQLREARLVAECGELCDELDVLSFDKDAAGLDRAFDKRSDAFKQAFPRVAANEDPFTSFRKIFDDPSYLAINVDSISRITMATRRRSFPSPSRRTSQKSSRSRT